MMKSIEGIFRNGRIELVEVPEDVRDETQVIVTFLEPDMTSNGIEDPAELRGRLESFAEEWESPEMDIYDDYDAARANAETR
jgi:hypothetical protein